MKNLFEEYRTNRSAELLQQCFLERLVVFADMAAAAESFRVVVQRMRMLPTAGRAAAADYIMGDTNVRAATCAGTRRTNAADRNIRVVTAARELDFSMNHLGIDVRFRR